MVIHCEGKSRQIGKCLQKRNGNHFGGHLLALFGDHFFCGRITFLLNLRYRGVWGLVCIPSSLYQIYHMKYSLLCLKRTLTGPDNLST